MELQDYIAIVRKRWLTIALITLLCLAGAIAVTAMATPVYQSHAQVYVSVRSGGSTADLVQGSNYTQRQVKSYVELVRTPRVLTPVIEQLDLPTTPADLALRVSADSPLDTSLINIRVSDESPQVASDVANAVTQSLAAEVAVIERPENEPSPVVISTVRPATVPEQPASPNPVRNLALALVAGLGLGFGVAVLRELLDTRVRSEADVRQVSTSSVIATVAYDDDAPGHPLIVHSNPQSLRSEAIRRLRTNLQFLDTADGLRSIVVTSSLPGEGKSTTSVNLAISLADAGSRVVLVDADLRRPSVASYMGLEGRAGLTTVLIGRAELDDVVQPWGNGYLHVLPSGQVPPNPSELLGSQAMAALLEQLRERYDLVILDTPPLLPVTDAAILARFTNGALVVVAADKLRRQHLSESLGALETVGARVLGVVLNRVARKQSDTYAYYEYVPRGERLAPARRQPRRRRGSNPVRAPGHAAERPNPERRHSGPSLTRSEERANPDESGALERVLDEELPPATAQRWPGEPLSRG